MTDALGPHGLHSGDRVRSKLTPGIVGVVQSWIPKHGDWDNALVLIRWNDPLFGWSGEIPTDPDTLERIEG